jgi:hypothetical protein
MSLIYIGVVIILILLYFASIENFETADFEQALRNRLAELQQQEAELEKDEFDFREEFSKAEKLARIRAKELKCQELLRRGIEKSGKGLLGIATLMNPFLIASWPGAALAAGYSLVGPSESEMRTFCFEDDYFEKLPTFLKVLEMDNPTGNNYLYHW